MSGSEAWSVTVLTGVALALRLWGLGRQSLWFDETFTVLVARRSWADGIAVLLADGVHPPGFYWLEKIWLGVLPTASEFIVRLPAMIAGVLAVPLLYALGRQTAGARSGMLAALLLALSPFHWWYSQDARMYSILALLAILSTSLYLSLYARRSALRQVAFVLVSAVAYVTHYFALFLPLIQFVHQVLHLRRQPDFLRRWVVWQALAALPILAWIGALLTRDAQVFGIGWIEPSSWLDFPLTLLNFSVGYSPPLRAGHWLGLFLFVAAILLGLRQQWPRATARSLLFLWAVLPPVIILLISLRRPTYVDRFFILVQPAFLLIASRGLIEPHAGHPDGPGARGGINRLAQILAAVTLVLLILWGGWRTFLGPDRPAKEDWRGTASHLNAQARADELIVVRVLQILVPLNYYPVAAAPVEVLEANRVSQSLAELAAGSAGVWLVYWNASFDAHALASSPPFQPGDETDPAAGSWLNGAGPPLIQRLDFRGTTLLRFAGP